MTGSELMYSRSCRNDESVAIALMKSQVFVQEREGFTLVTSLLRRAALRHVTCTYI
jgi:hypothetical protein